MNTEEGIQHCKQIYYPSLNKQAHRRLERVILEVPQHRKVRMNLSARNLGRVSVSHLTLDVLLDVNC